MGGYKSTVATILIGTIAANVAIVRVVDAKSLTAKEVYNSANKFVVKIDGADGGSGFIVRRNGNRYTVITNDHVTKTSDRHTITTHDGKTYTSEGVKSFKSSDGLDLAEIEFESNTRYPVAQLASQPDYSVGSKIYSVGWNATYQNLTERSSNLLDGTISGSQRPDESGYAIKMNLNVVRGMSGSPLLDENGKVFGIYGRAIQTITFGIPISAYRKLAPSSKSVADADPIDRSSARRSRVSAVNNDRDRTEFNFRLAYKRSIPNSGYVYGLSMSPDNQFFATGDSKGSVSIWNLSNGENIKTINGSDNSQIGYAIITPDKSKIITDGGNNIKIWSIDNGRFIRNLNSDFSSIKSLAIDSEGKKLVSASSDDGAIKIWSISDEEISHIRTIEIAKNNEYRLPLSITKDGRYIVSLTKEGIKKWGINTGELIKSLSGKYSDFVITNSGEILAIDCGYTNSATLKVVKFSDGQVINTFKSSHRFESVAISNGNSDILFTGGSGAVQIWRLSDGKLLKTIEGFDSSIRSIVISQDDKIIAAQESTKIYILRAN
jgi:WD40 repeat protein